jgi:hypothetical protein
MDPRFRACEKFSVARASPPAFSASAEKFDRKSRKPGVVRKCAGFAGMAGGDARPTDQLIHTVFRGNEGEMVRLYLLNVSVHQGMLVAKFQKGTRFHRHP